MSYNIYFVVNMHISKTGSKYTTSGLLGVVFLGQKVSQDVVEF